jgi:hypothetical protein
MNNFKRMGTILSGSLLASVLLAGQAQAALFDFTIDAYVQSNQGTVDLGIAGDFISDFTITGQYDSDTAFPDGFGLSVIDFNLAQNSWAVTTTTTPTVDNPLVGLTSDSESADGFNEMYFLANDFSAGGFDGLYFVDILSINIFDGFGGFTVQDGNIIAAGLIDYGQQAANVGAVPVPAAVWLFGSALLGLVGFNRRKPAVAAA